MILDELVRLAPAVVAGSVVRSGAAPALVAASAGALVTLGALFQASYERNRRDS